MMDLASITSLLFETSKEWTAPKIVRMHRLAHIEREPAYLQLKADGNEMVWASETKIRQLAREGWRPVTERDAILRPTIFMDRNSEVLLMYHPNGA
jgi:hypothetical protein